MEPISESNARNQGLRPVTEAESPAAPVKTTNGNLSFQAWCEREAARYTAAGRVPQLVKSAGKVALWALPPAEAAKVLKEAT